MTSAATLLKMALECLPGRPSVARPTVLLSAWVKSYSFYTPPRASASDSSYSRPVSASP